MLFTRIIQIIVLYNKPKVLCELLEEMKVHRVGALGLGVDHGLNSFNFRAASYALERDKCLKLLYKLGFRKTMSYGCSSPRMSYTVNRILKPKSSYPTRHWLHIPWRELTLKTLKALNTLE